MTNNNLQIYEQYLLNLFFGLQEVGLALEIRDYQLFLEALNKGFAPQNFQELKQLCRRLWVKSVADEKILNDYFDNCIKKSFTSNTQEENDKQPIQESQQKLQGTDKSSESSSNTNEETHGENQHIDKTNNETNPNPDEKVGAAISQKQQISGDFTLNDEYFPVTRRELQQGWRFLRRPRREGIATELDVLATVEKISQQGFLLEPVLIPSQINQTKLLLLIDESNSMTPFSPLTKRLIETSQQGGRLGDFQTYYFSNFPRDSLYCDSKLLNKKLLAEIIPHLDKNHTLVIIFSDGGAARGGLNTKRIEFTKTFLTGT